MVLEHVCLELGGQDQSIQIDLQNFNTVAITRFLGWIDNASDWKSKNANTERTSTHVR